MCTCNGKFLGVSQPASDQVQVEMKMSRAGFSLFHIFCDNNQLCRTKPVIFDALMPPPDLRAAT
jgi:hypothetical protein